MKSNQAVSRLKKRAIKTVANTEPENTTPPQGNPMSLKQVEAILLNVSLQELFNHGDQRDLDFVQQILAPNNIKVPEGQPLEAFWDIVNNSGFIKAKIGFGNQGRVALTKEGYQLMAKYGSYFEYLKEQEEAKNGKAPCPEKEDEVKAETAAKKDTPAKEKPVVKDVPSEKPKEEKPPMDGVE